jgi:hypothetical protein
MSTPQHTPGPWNTVAYLDERDRRGRNVLVSGDVEGAKFRVHGRNHTIAYTVPNKADARLIAAAPELLAALERIDEEWHLAHDALKAGNRDEVFRLICRWQDGARAALADAKGEQR